MISKLEIGCGPNPTPGYLHNDVNHFEGVDFVCDAWDIDLPEGSLDEIIALGVMEHFTYAQFDLVLAKMARLCKPGALFLFDVPDVVTWCKYLVDIENGKSAPFPEEHILATLYGWQRWSGDEHKSGWTRERLKAKVQSADFSELNLSALDQFLQRGLTRRRMTRPADAHIYCAARR